MKENNIYSGFVTSDRIPWYVYYNSVLLCSLCCPHFIFPKCALATQDTTAIRTRIWNSNLRKALGTSIWNSNLRNGIAIVVMVSDKYNIYFNIRLGAAKSLNTN